MSLEKYDKLFHYLIDLGYFLILEVLVFEKRVFFLFISLLLNKVIRVQIMYKAKLLAYQWVYDKTIMLDLTNLQWLRKVNIYYLLYFVMIIYLKSNLTNEFVIRRAKFKRKSLCKIPAIAFLNSNLLSILNKIDNNPLYLVQNNSLIIQS